ncbi:isopentenyl phosphate kinase family protein [Methanosarcina sp. KYL-1]|uniref:isopentenyl phosphate kinase n=1 Tax=Methanosarcina sp. KYL-1 TaxID=2602068 RepID=UPI002100B985|nr:isopentenyl phosphate kinase [Methanosarcina sp. KYL-1]MCQ1534585.1 isopentenyl phosphate kinase family protein [Methanosarcina sp. KYL-1]
MNTSTETVILKLGGSVITDKGADEGVVREADLLRIAREVSGYRGKMIVVHGAGSFGHTYAKKYGLDRQFDPEGAIVTHESVKKLAATVVNSLNRFGVRAIAVHPMGCTVCKNGRIESMYLDNIKLMLEKGFVPVLHGDVVMDTELGACILSGDQIVPYLAKKLGVTRLGLGSAEDGVLDKDGKPVPEITPGNFEEFRGCIGASGNTDVTGGMLGKVRELLDLSKTSCITSYIFNAGKADNVHRFLSGEPIGTRISPDKGN